jgi:hypothetical protein
MLLTALLVVVGALLLAVCVGHACAVGHSGCGELECSRPIQRLARKLGCTCSSQLGLALLIAVASPRGPGVFSAMTPASATLSQVCSLRI